MDELSKVFVTSIIDPSMFWARIGCDVELETEQTMEDVIKDYVSQVRDRNEFQDMKLAPNQIILAKSNEHGGRWLRATAVSCSSSQDTSEIDVVFPGYGSNELVGWNDIITSAPDYVCEWKKSAECFKLDGIEPESDDSWSAEAIEYFSNCVLKKRLSCRRMANNRLVIYTSNGKHETIQDCLIRKRFAKHAADGEIVVTPSKMNGHRSTSTAAATGGIPEFDTTGLFFRVDSPPLPLEETPPTRDFEMELRRRLLDTSEVGIPTHSDDVYCGRRSANSLGSEPYAKKVRDIKEELAQISKVDRQLVRSEGWRGANNHPWANRSATDPRNGSKSSKILENSEDDWRMPKASHSLSSPYDESRKCAKYENESFKEELRKHLNKNSTREVILAFLRPILMEDDLLHHRLFSCLTTIVDQTLENETLMVRSLDLLESLKYENEFHKWLATAIVQCHADCIQIADFEFLKLRLISFTELLAQLLLKFPEESKIVDCALEIADFWITSKIKLSDVQSVQKLYASCLKNFICIVAHHSVCLVRQNLFRLLNAVREMLVADVQPRSVREIWLDLLLYVEQKETESRMMSNNTFSQIVCYPVVKVVWVSSGNAKEEFHWNTCVTSGNTSKEFREQWERSSHRSHSTLTSNHSQLKHNGSMDFNDISSNVGPEQTSRSVSAASPTPSSASHSSFRSHSSLRSAGAASFNENHITPPASRSSPLITSAASLNESCQELPLNPPDRNWSESAESKPDTRKALKKKTPKKMSLQSFYATPASPVAVESTPSRAIFRDDVNCVTCGAQYHATADCPDRSSKFIL